jgi:hypothetical protein
MALGHYCKEALKGVELSKSYQFKDVELSTEGCSRISVSEESIVP